jgi:hypothetical protein
MRIRFNVAVLGDASCWRHVTNIAEQCASCNHQLDVSAIEAWEQMTEWLELPANRNVYVYIQGLVEQLVRGEPPEAAHQLEIEVHHQTPDPRGAVLSLQDAASYITQPAEVVVENATSDGSFFELLCYVFARTRIIEALQRRHLTFYNAGGYGNLWPIFERRRGEAPHGPYKLLVLKDGDSQHPAHRSDETARVEDKFIDGGALNHLLVLTGRDVENYMTRACLLTLPSSEELTLRVESFCRLSLEQRLHYDMECGLRAGEDATRDALYHGVGPELAPGFASNIKGSNKKPGPIRRELERHKRNHQNPNAPEPVYYHQADIKAELGQEVVEELVTILDRIEALL